MLWYCFTRKLLTTSCLVALELRIGHLQKVKLATVVNSWKLTYWFFCSNSFLNCVLSADLFVWLTNIYFLFAISIHNREKRLGEFLINRSPKDRALIVYQIFLTSSLRKFIDISLTRYKAGFSEPRETSKWKRRDSHRKIDPLKRMTLNVTTA